MSVSDEYLIPQVKQGLQVHAQNIACCIGDVPLVVVFPAVLGHSVYEISGHDQKGLGEVTCVHGNFWSLILGEKPHWYKPSL
jgi:hypothetical protein